MLQAEGGFSLESRSADKEPKNQYWVFWSMKEFFQFNQFGLFKENMTTSDSE